MQGARRFASPHTHEYFDSWSAVYNTSARVSIPFVEPLGTLFDALFTGATGLLTGGKVGGGVTCTLGGSTGSVFGGMVEFPGTGAVFGARTGTGVTGLPVR